MHDQISIDHIIFELFHPIRCSTNLPQFVQTERNSRAYNYAVNRGIPNVLKTNLPVRKQSS